MEKKIEEFIVDYLEREYKLPEGTDLNTFNYVKTGYVDSLGTILFISRIEEEFNIEFTDEDMEDEANQVVGNLIRTILSKVEA